MQRYYANVYWHFTGGPVVDWDEIKMPKDIKGKAKPDKKAFEILMKILSSKKLLAGKPETILKEISTGSFCCVCDIPIKDLIYHAEYYGKTAIGFSASTVHSIFKPVLYMEKQWPLFEDTMIDLDHEIDLNKEFDENASLEEVIACILGLEDKPEYIEAVRVYLGDMKDLVKITKFSQNDSETFYREREWRCKGDFEFTLKDVEAIITPKKYVSQLEQELRKDNDNHGVAIIPFELVKKM